MTTAQTPRSIADAVAGYWRELLGTQAVTPGDDFSALGGNSMLATMLANRIEDEFGVRPEIVDLFGTLDRVCQLCESLLADAEGPQP